MGCYDIYLGWMSRCYCAFSLSFSPETHIHPSLISIFHVDWCLPNRIEARPKVVVSRKHIHYCLFLCGICSCQVEVGCYFEYCGDKFECDGRFSTLVVGHPSDLWMLIFIPSLVDVGCIVWVDPRDIRYKRCVNLV